MAVPNNYSFSLQTVVNEIPGGQTSLQECFNESTDSLFDNAYKGSKNSLRNFRNYNAAPPTLTINPGSFTTDAQAVAFSITVSSNASWSVTDSENWINVSPSSGTGNGSITVSVLAYIEGGAERYGTITVTAGGITRSCIVEQTASGGPN